MVSTPATIAIVQLSSAMLCVAVCLSHEQGARGVRGWVGGGRVSINVTTNPRRDAPAQPQLLMRLRHRATVANTTLKANVMSLAQLLTQIMLLWSCSFWQAITAAKEISRALRIPRPALPHNLFR